MLFHRDSICIFHVDNYNMILDGLWQITRLWFVDDVENCIYYDDETFRRVQKNNSCLYFLTIRVKELLQPKIINFKYLNNNYDN